MNRFDLNEQVELSIPKVFWPIDLPDLLGEQLGAPEELVHWERVLSSNTRNLRLVSMSVHTTCMEVAVIYIIITLITPVPGCIMKMLGHLYLRICDPLHLMGLILISCNHFRHLVKELPTLLLTRLGSMER